MCDNEDVLTRLDTLLGGSPSLDSNASSTSSTPSSILKTSPSSSQQKKSLRFREETQLQEVIGYGGEESCASSDSEGEMETEKSTDDIIEELTVEEKNVLNLTRQNTTFNAHAQNLNTETNNAPLLRLGVDKKVTPIITVSSIFLALHPCTF